MLQPDLSVCTTFRNRQYITRHHSATRRSGARTPSLHLPEVAEDRCKVSGQLRHESQTLTGDGMLEPQRLCMKRLSLQILDRLPNSLLPAGSGRYCASLLKPFCHRQAPFGDRLDRSTVGQRGILCEKLGKEQKALQSTLS